MRLIESFQSHLKTLKIDPNSKILVAVSGGVDSVTLFNLFTSVWPKRQLGVIHCNYGLRGKESDLDEQFVCNLAQKAGVDFFVKRFSKKEKKVKSTEHKGKLASTQMWAREERFIFFEETLNMKGYDYVALGTHMDDQIETFMIQLLRGTGIEGLSGIGLKSSKYIRPLLGCYKNELIEFANRNDIEYREDASNQENKYVRNVLRNSILPAIETSFADYRKGFETTIGRLSKLQNILNTEYHKFKSCLKKEKELVHIAKDEIENYPFFSEHLWQLLKPIGFTSAQVDSLCSVIQINDFGQVFESNEYKIRVEREEIILEKKSVNTKFQSHLIQQIPFHIEDEYHLTGKIIENFPNTFTDKSIAYLNYETIHFPLEIRTWQKGDWIYPFGLNGKKKLSDWFIDRKFSQLKKNQTLLLCQGKEVIWIVGHTINHHYRVLPETNKIVQIQYLIDD